MPDPHWRASVIEYIRAEAQPVAKFGHQPRLYALACRIGQAMKFDDDVVFAAAWMHDLGVFLGHRPPDPEQLARWDHIPSTIARSRELLLAWGCPPAKIDAVASAIANHQPHNDPIEIESIILRDADILEQLGAVGALRAIAKVGRDTRFPTFTSVVPVLQKAVDDLPSKLRLRSARLLATVRVDSLESLISAIHMEAGQLLH
jgi:uncharacterized protein